MSKNHLKDEIRQAALNQFTCAELAAMSREKYNIEARIIQETCESLDAVLKLAQLRCSMWSPEYRKSIDEYLEESKNRYRVNYNEM